MLATIRKHITLLFIIFRFKYIFNHTNLKNRNTKNLEHNTNTLKLFTIANNRYYLVYLTDNIHNVEAIIYYKLLTYDTYSEIHFDTIELRDIDSRKILPDICLLDFIWYHRDTINSILKDIYENHRVDKCRLFNNK